MKNIVLFFFFFFSNISVSVYFFFFFQAEDGIRDATVTGVQTCALPICIARRRLVGVDGDREPGGHRQPGGEQLAEARVLAAEPRAVRRVVLVQPAHEGHGMPSHQSGRSARGGTWTSWTRLR